MARPDTEGRRRDWPQIEVAQIAAASAGSANDAGMATLVAAIPDPSQFFLPNMLNELAQGFVAPNRMAVRHAIWINNAANRAGNATHWFDYRLNVYRTGTLQGATHFYTMQVNTTITPAITASTAPQAVAVGAVTGIVPGMALYVDSGGTPELVYVLAVNVSGVTITAIFAKSHSSSATITSEVMLNRPIALVPAASVSGGTSSTSITAGSVAVTPTAVNGNSGMYGIHVNDYLYFSGGTGTAETVQVTAVTSTTFTCTFVNNHSGAYTFSTVAAGGPIGTSLTPLPQAGINYPFEMIPGDVVKFERVSSDSTGLASDAGIVQIDWVPSRVGR